MIKSFKDKETEKVYNREGSSKLPRDIQQVALRKLRMLNNVKSLNDLRVPPANSLEKMKGNREGQLRHRHKLTIAKYVLEKWCNSIPHEMNYAVC